MFEDIHIAKSDKEFLKILYHNGEVGTHQLTNQTEYNNSQVHRRFRKFEDAGVIETFVKNPEGKHWDRERFASLTTKAESAIQRGALGNIFTSDETDTVGQAEIEELKAEIEDLREETQYLRRNLREAEIEIKGHRWAIEESDLDFDIDRYKKKIREE